MGSPGFLGFWPASPHSWWWISTKAPDELLAAPGTVHCTAILLGASESEATES